MRKKYGIPVTDLIFIVLTLSSFTPFLIPYGEVNPKFIGIPYTVWMGVVYCILYIVLTYIASKIQEEGPDDN